MNKLNLKSANKINLCDWKELDTCTCGGPVFKYHMSSKNIYIVKCGYSKETLEIDQKSKKSMDKI